MCTVKFTGLAFSGRSFGSNHEKVGLSRLFIDTLLVKQRKKNRLQHSNIKDSECYCKTIIIIIIIIIFIIIIVIIVSMPSNYKLTKACDP